MTGPTGSTGGADAPADGSRPNVLLLVVDACRADYTSPYAPGVDWTPAFEALGREGTVFERAVSAAPWTLPSVTSVLTGDYPHEHGATSRGFAMRGERTVVHQLAAAGYRCVHLSPTTWIGDWLPQGRGFDRVEEFTGPQHRRFDGGRDVRDLTEGVSRGIEWYATAIRRSLSSSSPLRSLANAAAFKVSEATGDVWADDVRASERAATVADDCFASFADDDRPFFAYVHLMDPHLPFYVPPEFASDVRPPGCATDEEEREYVRVLMDDLWEIRLGERTLTEAEIRFLRARYADEVAYADSVVGRVLESLDRHGHAEETLVVLTGDHGEHLGEAVAGRTLLDHQTSVRLPLLRVPLVLRYPGEFDGDDRDDLVQTNYVADTVRALAELEYRPSRSLLDRDAAYTRDAALAEYAGVVASHPPDHLPTDRLLRPRATAIAGEWKLDRVGGERRAARIDWAANREVAVDEGNLPQAIRETLAATLDDAVPPRRESADGSIPSDVERRLEDLGYR
ncbi:sulfatase-like hydrolase/transferase [Halomarina pelagica]|uniref:sulfatase-like hydrolase/transferase n=1 Tax=Halomarina pelagica TaxID=2961599 RepID=UPI0020C388E7|nr:sulfatase-like hydrolase/transferase [Halomarina sp. BND7]